MKKSFMRPLIRLLATTGLGLTLFFAASACGTSSPAPSLVGSGSTYGYGYCTPGTSYAISYGSYCTSGYMQQGNLCVCNSAGGYGYGSGYGSACSYINGVYVCNGGGGYGGGGYGYGSNVNCSMGCPAGMYCSMGVGCHY